MKVYKSLKKVPVTKLFSNIVTAHTSTQSFEDRTPFIVYLPSGKEGIAVGGLHQLTTLMNDQSEGRIDVWTVHEEPTHLKAFCDFGGVDVTLIIEPVASYVTMDSERKEAEDAEEADYENDTL